MEMEGKGHTVASRLPSVEQRKLEIAIAGLRTRIADAGRTCRGHEPRRNRPSMVEIQSLRGMGITILLVEHNMRVISGICDHVVVINYGEKIVKGPRTWCSMTRWSYRATSGRSCCNLFQAGAPTRE